MILDVVTLPREYKGACKTQPKSAAMKQAVCNFEEGYERCYDNFDMYSKEPLVVGRYGDYGGAALDTGNSSIFVHDNVVYRKCRHSQLHEIAIGEISYDIESSLRLAFGSLFFGLGAATQDMFNYHGCCSIFGKEPDFSFALESDIKRHERYPVIAGEIAVAHKNQHLLFLEAMVYLNSFTTIQYCVLVDILLCERFFSARVVVCERALEGFHFYESRQRSFIARKKEAKNRKKNNLLVPGDDEDVCVTVQDKSDGSKQEIEDNYHIRIIFDQTIRLNSEEDKIMNDLVFYLRRDLLVRNTAEIGTMNISALLPIRITAWKLNRIIEEFNETKTQSSN